MDPGVSIITDPRNGGGVGPGFVFPNPSNGFVAQRNLPAYRCPSDVGPDLVSDTDQTNRNGFDGISLANASYGGVAGSNYNWGNYANGVLPANGFLSGNGVFPGGANTVRFRDVVDGLSNTAFVGEKLGETTPWAGWYSVQHSWGTLGIPINAAAQCTAAGINYAGRTDYNSWVACRQNFVWPVYADTAGFRSLHTGGAQFTLGEGSVRFLSANIDQRVSMATGTRAGGEIEVANQ